MRQARTPMLLARVRKGMQDEQGLTEQRLAHFAVHYDGEAHEEVGREILRVLDRHYATLATSLDHQPKNKITVILFSQERYYDASGAPAWSGGAFDGIDGKNGHAALAENRAQLALKSQQADGDRPAASCRQMHASRYELCSVTA